MVWFAEWSLVPSVAVVVTAILLLILDKRRTLAVILAVQYLFVTWLAALSLPILVASVKLIAGVMACSILSIAPKETKAFESKKNTRGVLSGLSFRIIAAILIIASALGWDWGTARIIEGLSWPATYASTVLMGFGFLQFGFNERPFRVGIGLLSLLSGFEIAYATIEPSLAVVALLAAIHIGIALVIGYLNYLDERVRSARGVL
jgi:hypothetical protein